MIEVLCGRRSETAEDLKEKLADLKVNKHVIVNWTGSPVNNLDHLAEVVLNGEARSNKLNQAIRLGTAGIPTITVSLRKEGPEWFPRRSSHQQGFDFTNKKLRRGVIPADFYVKKEDLTDEYRIHIFRTSRDNMRVLRIAHKVPSCDHPHPWVRSHRLGWKLSYVGGASDAAKQIARDAVRALQLDFGAVDIGIRRQGDPIVLEVNTCPGLEGGTLEMYVDNIKERAV